MAKRVREEETVVISNPSLLLDDDGYDYEYDGPLLANRDVFSYILSFITPYEVLSLMAMSRNYSDAVLCYVDFYCYIYELPSIGWSDFPMAEMNEMGVIEFDNCDDINEIILSSRTTYEQIKKRQSSLDRYFNQFALEVYRVLGVATRLHGLFNELGFGEGLEDSDDSALFYEHEARSRFIGPSSLEEIDSYASAVEQRQRVAIKDSRTASHYDAQYIWTELIIDSHTHNVDFLATLPWNEDAPTLMFLKDDRRRLLLNDKRHVLLTSMNDAPVMSQCHYDVRLLKRRISDCLSSIYPLIDTRNLLARKVHSAWQEVEDEPST